MNTIPCIRAQRAMFPNIRTFGSAAYDLSSIDEVDIVPNHTVRVDTGLTMAIPDGYVGLICSRSGLASQGVIVLNAPGVIDSDYRGPIKVLLHNVGEKVAVILPGERVAQILFVKCERVGFTEPDPTTWEWMMASTQRGAGGFGSTGK